MTLVAQISNLATRVGYLFSARCRSRYVLRQVTHCRSSFPLRTDMYVFSGVNS